MSARLAFPGRPLRNEPTLQLLIGASLACVIGVLAVRWPAHLATVSFGLPIVITLPLVFIRPKMLLWSFAILVFLAPMASYVKAFTGLIYAPAVLDLALMVIGVMAIVPRLAARDLSPDLQTKIVGCLILLGTVQMFNPRGPGLYLAAYGYRILILPVIGFIIGRYSVQSVRDVRIVLFSMLASSVLVSAYAIKQSLYMSSYDEYIIYATVGAPETYTSLGQVRAFSTMSGPFHLAAFMMACILLMVCVGFVKGRYVEILLLLALYGAALVLSIVRSSWFGVIGGTMFLCSLMLAGGVAESGKLRRIAYLMVPLVLIVMLLVNVAASGGALGLRIASMLAPTSDSNFQLRWDSWIDSLLPAVVNNPLGYGIGADTTAEGSAFYAHNGFIYIAIELGVIGLLVVTGLLGGGVLSGIQSARQTRDPEIKILGLWLAAWIVAEGVQAITGPLLEIYPVNLYLWFFLGAHAALRRDPFGEVHRAARAARQREDARARSFWGGVQGGAA